MYFYSSLNYQINEFIKVNPDVVEHSLFKSNDDDQDDDDATMGQFASVKIQLSKAIDQLTSIADQFLRSIYFEDEDLAKIETLQNALVMANALIESLSAIFGDGEKAPAAIQKIESTEIDENIKKEEKGFSDAEEKPKKVRNPCL